jgi:hypothetical protein
MIEGSGSIPLTNGSGSRTKSYGSDGSGSFGSGSATLHLIHKDKEVWQHSYDPGKMKKEKKEDIKRDAQN